MCIIPKCLSVRHIIMQAWQALVGLCLYVCNELTIEIYGFTHSFTYLSGWCHRDGRLGRRQQARERVQRYRRCLIAQQRDLRRQDKSDRRQLACQHLSDSLHSLTHERDPFHPIDNFPRAWCETHDAHVYT